jgi:hypothetical protein
MAERNDLADILKRIQDKLHSSEELGRKHLEELGEEAMHAFDAAIKVIERKINVRHEIGQRRPFLKQWKVGLIRTLRPVSWAIRHTLSLPFIWLMVVPSVFLHLCLEFYQQITFRLYGIPRVRARDYFVFDRALLPYLNWVEKLNCLYCSYVNHLFQFAVEIGGRTERYWCPIKYANRMRKTHSQYELFIDYLEADTLREKWDKLRDFRDLKNDLPPEQK